MGLDTTVSIGNIVTWGLVLVTFGSLYGRLQNQIAVINKWIQTHERETASGYERLRLLEQSVVKLTTITEMLEKHMDAIQKAARIYVERGGK